MTMPKETVKAGRGGTKIHLRYPNSVQTICGQGMGSRGGRRSYLFPVSAAVTCSGCLKKTDTHMKGA